MRIQYTAQARLDLLEGLSYYEEHQPGLAADFYKEFSQAELDVLEAPEFWHPLKKRLSPQALETLPLQSGLPYRE